MTMNRIDSKFQELRKKGKKAFIAYITAGDPSLAGTQQLVLAFEKAGVDIIELGVPFSDPLADGPTIQAASQRALKKKTTVAKIFHAVRSLRKKTQIPIALMTYYNPVYHFGEQRFIHRCRACGVDGVIIPDLPPDEAGEIIKIARREGIATIFFLSPTTIKERMKKIIQASTGFIYYVSLKGVTGARTKLPASVIKNVKIAKRFTRKPICVGFGISQPSQVRSIARIADGIIVGSAIIQQIVKHQGKKDFTKKVARFVASLSKDL